jgi:hypothetical protein
MMKALLTGIMLLFTIHVYAEVERPASPIVVVTDKADYFSGEQVIIEGRVPTLTDGREVNIIVKDAYGQTFTKLRVKPLSNSSFSTSFHLPAYEKLFPEGIWTINVGYAIWAARAEINVHASENRSVIIYSTEIRPQNINAGNQVTIISEVKNNAAQKIFYIVQLKHDGSTVFLQWEARMLASRETAEFSVKWTPEVKGEYILEIFVWDDLEDPTPLSPFHTATLTVY